MTVSKTRAQTVELDFDDIFHLGTLEGLEDDNLIDTVDEFGAEAFFAQELTYLALHFVFVHAIEGGEPLATNVAGHDDDGVFEVDSTTLAVSEATIIEELE